MKNRIQTLMFPSDDKCMNGLTSLREIDIADLIVPSFPSTIVGLPAIEAISLIGAPVGELPALGKNLRKLKMPGSKISGKMPSFKGLLELEYCDLRYISAQLSISHPNYCFIQQQSFVRGGGGLF